VRENKAGGRVSGAIDVSASRGQFFAFDVGVDQGRDAAAGRRRKFIFSLSAGERIIAIGNIFMTAAICAAKNPQQIE
jgi:hypothetical protein